MPGKRKRETAVLSRASEAESHGDSKPPSGASHDLFRQFFESRFQPLDPPSINDDDGAEEDSVEEDSEKESELEWEGISDTDDEVEKVEVVEYADARDASDSLDKHIRKAFMSAKPPSLSEPSTTTGNKANKATKGKDEADVAGEAENLKNDFALQRLLKESHLLESASDLNPTGVNRHKALDLRLQSLGAKKSIFGQQKMPKSHWVGIQAKATNKEDTRRREARENGIILEKPTFKSKGNANKRRERGIGAPSIGKFAGGTLRLSSRDLVGMKSSRGSKGAKRGRR